MAVHRNRAWDNANTKCEFQRSQSILNLAVFFVSCFLFCVLLVSLFFGCCIVFSIVLSLAILALLIQSQNGTQSAHDHRPPSTLNTDANGYREKNVKFPSNYCRTKMIAAAQIILYKLHGIVGCHTLTLCVCACAFSKIFGVLALCKNKCQNAVNFFFAGKLTVLLCHICHILSSYSWIFLLFIYYLCIVLCFSGVLSLSLFARCVRFVRHEYACAILCAKSEWHQCAVFFILFSVVIWKISVNLVVRLHI